MLTRPSEIPAYKRWDLELVKGRGCTVWDREGGEYLDLYGGHAVALTGHCHPRVVSAIKRQAEELVFYSNVVSHQARDQLFDLLAELGPAGLDQSFLVNSGAEANEQALALARRKTGRSRVVSIEGGFHGRTLVTLAVSGIERYRSLAGQSEAGRRLTSETEVCPVEDVSALDSLIGDDTAALILEPVQGLSGALDLSPGFLHQARELCTERGALLIFDEVQCGCGRTGAFTAAQSFGVTPDLLTLAKGIAGGLPLGAVLASKTAVVDVGPGDLGSTFGGAPVPCAAAVANLSVVRDEALCGRVTALSSVLTTRIETMPGVRGVQGSGFLLGVLLERPAAEVWTALYERRVLTGLSLDPHILRLVPPLVLGEDEVHDFLDRLHDALV